MNFSLAFAFMEIKAEHPPIYIIFFGSRSSLKHSKSKISQLAPWYLFWRHAS